VHEFFSHSQLETLERVIRTKKTGESMKKHFFSVLMLVTALPAFACVNNFCQGSEVLYTPSKDSGVVVEAFSNGKVKVNWDKYTTDSVVDMSTLVSRQECFENICTNSRVLYTSGDMGTVLTIYSNGLMSVDWDKYTTNSIVEFSSLSIEKKCQEGFCTGARVMYTSKDTGTILQVYSNGKAQVDWDNFTTHSIVLLSQLSKGYRCSGNLCRGERVIYGTETGSVVEIFNNGSIVVDWDNFTNNSAVNITTLGFALEKCFN
jgi:hypothetical protein